MATPDFTNVSNPSWFLYGPGNARMEGHEIPTILDRPHDVIVTIAYTGVCGSDVHFWHHGGVNEKVRQECPLIMGHEASGTVAAVGSAVKKLVVGDRVALEPGFPCRRCSFCLAGKYQLCADMSFAASPGPGKMTHGTLTTFFALPEDFCYKIPDSIGLDEAVLFEPLAVAVHACRLADVKPGHRVLVCGAGPVGLLSCAVAKEFGAASVVVTDVNSSRLAFAIEFAATSCYKYDTTLSSEENAEMLNGLEDLLEGPNVVIEATGLAQSVQSGIFAIKKGGSYVQVGLGHATVDFPLVIMSQKEINMKGSFRYGAGDFELASNLVRRGRIDVKKLITKIVPFEKTIEAWETASRGDGIKTLICGRQAYIPGIELSSV